MCECKYKPCPSEVERKFSILMLDCWQREYDKRPYHQFQFNENFFEERMKRKFDAEMDFPIIIDFLKKRKTLQSTKLSGMKLLDVKISLLNDFIKSLYKLPRIELSLCEFPTKFFELLQENVHKMLVRELILQGTPLDDFSLTHLRSFLIGTRTLLHLNVSHCSINQHNFATLADGVQKSKTLLQFNASRLLGNTLSMDSFKIAHILSFLIWQKKLQELTMQKCELVGQDIEIFAEYLYDCNNPLRKLNLSYNLIGPDGLEYLLKAIACSKQLKHLELNGCAVAAHGGELVAKYLSSCKFLNYLALQNNDMTAESVSMILLTMKKPMYLQKLYLWGNKYDNRTGDILHRLLDSGVVPQQIIDMTVTYDGILNGYRVIPCLASEKRNEFLSN